MRYLVFAVFLVLFFSCSTKKDILYIQDSKEYKEKPLKYDDVTIQPNDILRIMVSALEIKAALPYNFQLVNAGGGANQNNQNMDGYVVSQDYFINFPVLGKISVKGLTPIELEDKLKIILEEGNHISNPTVNVRIVNAKFTVLGQVSSPGTFTFTDQNLTILQAIGLAGDLTINGKREDITLIREVDGVRRVTHLDITSMAITDSPYYFIKPNDVIVVNPNGPQVKKAGYLPNLGALLGFASFAITLILLIQN